MKLEVGMYVRTNKGIYLIINNVQQVLEGYTFIDGKCINTYEITKSSYNLIDLIEVGDIVKVCDCFNGHIDEIYIIDDKDGGNSLETLKAIIDKSGYEIKEILTHEQYNANKYVVGSE